MRPLSRIPHLTAALMSSAAVVLAAGVASPAVAATGRLDTTEDRQSAASEANPVARYRLTGKVVDRATGDPLAGITVSVEGTSRLDVTSARGRYVIRGLRTGTYDVTAAGGCFGPATREVLVDGRERLKFRLECAIELQARANLPSIDEGFNLPPGSSFNSISADLSDNDDVAFRVQLVPDEEDPSSYRPGVWLGGHGQGEIVYTGDIDVLIDNEASVNDAGDIAFTLSDSGLGNTLYRYDASTGTGAALGTAPVIPNSYGSPNLNNDGDIGFQANFGSGRGYAALLDGTGVLYAADEDVSPGSPFTYLYTPSFNDAGQIAAKVATSADLTTKVEIRIFEADGTSVRVLANTATDPTSPYSKFDNSLALSDDGEIAVIATRTADSRRVVVRTDGTTTTEIAEVDPAGTIRSLEFFAPSINDAGQVAFRAVDATGQAVYVADGSSLERIIGKGDVVQTDLGTAQIGQHDASAVFAGRPSINADGDVAFVAGLHPEGDSQSEWGSGVFVAYAS